MSPLLLPLPCPSPAHFKPVPPAHETHEAFFKRFKILLQGPVVKTQYLGDLRVLQGLCTRKHENFTLKLKSGSIQALCCARALSGYFDDSIAASRRLKLDLILKNSLKHRKMTVMRTIRLGGRC
ncbi:hypothetical protein B0H12DRAFT_1104166 [Mycena haematopus]|nr:hypothetical protein B0H12DRAFT_1104166 [Mycena haematopus]